MSDAKPKGVVVAFIAPDGHVVASVSDFQLGSPGGFSLAEAQRQRCSDALPFTVLGAMCHSDVAKAVERYDGSQILERMVRKQGYRIEMIEIGHD